MKGTIVFASGRAGDYDIFTLKLETQEVTQLTQGPYLNDQPRWSPDGRTIAFISNRSGIHQIWLMNADGTDQRPLTTTNTHHTHPVWTPDGQAIACCSNYADKQEVNIWKVPLSAPERPEVLVESLGLEGDFCFDPSGQTLVVAATYQGNYDLFSINLQSKERRQLTTHLGKDFSPALSPDGSLLAFVSTPEWDPASKVPPTNADIYLMDAAGSKEPLKITRNRGSDQHVCWSPDGRHLCFCAGSTFPGTTRLKVIDLEQGKLTKLSYDRSKLEAELNATVQDSGFITSLVPDAVQRLGVYATNPAYFGAERYPHWKAS